MIAATIVFLWLLFALMIWAMIFIGSGERLSAKASRIITVVIFCALAGVIICGSFWVSSFL